MWHAGRSGLFPKDLPFKLDTTMAGWRYFQTAAAGLRSALNTLVYRPGTLTCRGTLLSLLRSLNVAGNLPGRLNVMGSLIQSASRALPHIHMCLSTSETWFTYIHQTTSLASYQIQVRQLCKKKMDIRLADMFQSNVWKLTPWGCDKSARTWRMH